MTQPVEPTPPEEQQPQQGPAATPEDMDISQAAAAGAVQALKGSVGIAKARAAALALGRPSQYDPVVAELICNHIQSGKSLNSFCLEYGIKSSTVYSWSMSNADFAAAYARAHSDRADTLVDDMLDIADKLATATDLVEVMAAKVRIDTRKWIAERMRPEKYGTKLQVEHKAPVTFNMGIPKRRANDVIDVSPVQSAS